MRRIETDLICSDQWHQFNPYSIQRQILKTHAKSERAYSL